MRYLSPVELLIVHVIAVEFYDEYEQNVTNEQLGVKDSKLLLSALHQAEQTYDGTELYQGVFLKAACLVRGIIQNHAFHNANKRTGILAMIVFLGLNGYEIRAGQNQLIHFARRIAIIKPSLESIALQIKKWSVDSDVMNRLALKPGKRRYMSDFINSMKSLAEKFKG